MQVWKYEVDSRMKRLGNNTRRHSTAKFRRMREGGSGAGTLVPARETQFRRGNLIDPKAVIYVKVLAFRSDVGTKEAEESVSIQ